MLTPLAALLVAGASLAPYGGPEVLFRLPADLTESSGVASSSISDDWLFTHQDSGDDGQFYAVDRQGRLLATYRLGVQARDWEDMARGPDEQGRSSLWLADIGDNRETRDGGLLVHRVPEPPVDPARRQRTVDLEPTSFRLVYEDGPRDAESLLVHPRTGRLYVVSKEVFRRPGLYAAPERLDRGAPNVLRRLGDLGLPRTTTPGGPAQGGAVRVLVTAGDLSPDGGRLAVRTYSDLFEWQLEDGDPQDALDAEPTVTPLPPTEQGEGLAYSRDGSAVLLTTEGRNAPVHRLTGAAPARPPAAPGAPPPGRPGGGQVSEPPGDGPSYLLVGVGALVAAAGLAGVLTRRRRRPYPGR